MSLTPMKLKVHVDNLLNIEKNSQSEITDLIEDYCIAHNMESIIEDRPKGVNSKYFIAYVCAEHKLESKKV